MSRCIASDVGFVGSLGTTLTEVLPDNQFTAKEDPHKRSSVTLEEARLLASIAANRHVLEIGTGLGVSTLAMERTATQIVTVDTDPWVAANVILPESVWRVASMDRVPPLSFDMVFIDGAHDYKSVKDDIKAAWSVMPVGGIVVFHDANQDDVALAISEEKWKWIVEHQTCGKLTVASW